MFPLTSKVCMVLLSVIIVISWQYLSLPSWEGSIWPARPRVENEKLLYEELRLRLGQNIQDMTQDKGSFVKCLIIAC